MRALQVCTSPDMPTIYQPEGAIHSRRAIAEISRLVRTAMEPASAWLIDLQDATLGSNTHSDLMQFCDAASALIRNNPCSSLHISVVAQDDLTFGLSNIVRLNLESHHDHCHTHISRKHSSALSWLTRQTE